jgi:hypothetical protein
MSPYRPTFSDDSPLAGTALVTKIRSPQTTGLEWPRPGIAVFQRMFLPDSTFHSMGGAPAPTPLAEGPRNWGQLGSVALEALPGKAARDSKQIAQSFMHANITPREVYGCWYLPSPSVRPGTTQPISLPPGGERTQKHRTARAHRTSQFFADLTLQRKRTK